MAWGKKAGWGVALALLAFATGTATAQKLVLPKEVRGDRDNFIVIAADTDYAKLVWVPMSTALKVVPPDMLKDPRRTMVTGPNGTYTLMAYGAKGDSPSAPAYTTVVIGPPAPNPDPGPGPGPNPPEPNPNPAPIPAPGFRVLIVFEAAELSSYPPAQLAVIYSGRLRDYLDAKCVKEAGGKPGWNIWDKDVVIKDESQIWKDAMARPRVPPKIIPPKDLNPNIKVEEPKALPWIIVSNGKTGYEGPLPANVDKTLELVKKYGGE